MLIGSSLTMALAIHAAQAGKKKSEQVMYLILTMILGALFLFLKFSFEWHARLRRAFDPRLRLYHPAGMGRGRRRTCRCSSAFTFS